MQSPCLAIVAGAGDLPIQIVEHCKSNNIDFKIIHFEGVDLHWLKQLPVINAKFEKPNALFASLNNCGCNQVVFAGAMKRPKLNPLKFDAKFLKIASKLLPALKSGDDTTLKIIAEIFEKEGFEIIATDKILKNIFVSEGVFTKKIPSENDLIDIMRGFEILNIISKADIGQACVIAQGLCLGIETIQGSDALIKFAGQSKKNYLHDESDGKGVFIKSPKLNQDNRIDVPTVGVETIRTIAEAGLSGLAIKADCVQMIDKNACIDTANHLGIFITSVSSDKVL